MKQGRTLFLRMDSITSGGTSVTGFPRSSLPDTLSNLRPKTRLWQARPVSWRFKGPAILLLLVSLVLPVKRTALCETIYNPCAPR